MISDYKKAVEQMIHRTLGHSYAKILPSYDPLMMPEEHEARIAHYRSKTINQRHGHVWQRCFGAYPGFRDLGEKGGGLDLIHHKRRIIVELKSSTNTDNSSSRHKKLSLLAEYQRDNPGWTAVYGCVFDHKGNLSSEKRIRHDGQWIRVLVGDALFRFLFDDDADMVRDTVVKAVLAYKEKMILE